MKKIIMLLVLVVGLTTTISAQSDKMKTKVEEKVEQLNTEVSSVDQSLALTVEQREQIATIELERLKALRQVKKSGGDKEAKKAVHKPLNEKINKEILTKKQRQAKKAFKKKMKKDN